MNMILTCSFYHVKQTNKHPNKQTDNFIKIFPKIIQNISSETEGFRTYSVVSNSASYTWLKCITLFHRLLLACVVLCLSLWTEGSNE